MASGSTMMIMLGDYDNCHHGLSSSYLYREKQVMVNMAMNKTKKVLMKVSHCPTPNGRLDYAKVRTTFLKLM